MSAPGDDIDASSAPLIEHLTELRNRIVWSLVAFVIGIIIAFSLAAPVFDFLSQPICDALFKRGQNCQLVLISPQEGFFVAMNLSLFGGLVMAFPIIAYQMWRFVAPGLYRSEKQAFLPFLIASPAMFFIGAAFSYYVVLPIAFDFFLGFQQGPLSGVTPGAAAPATGSSPPAGIVFQGSAQQYLSTTMKFILAFGLCFQLPVLLTLMGKAGLVTSAGLASVRRYAILAIVIIAAVVTPPDMMSQLILFAAIYPLYEVSILLIARIERRREAEMRADGTWQEPEPDTPVAAPTPAATTPATPPAP